MKNKKVKILVFVIVILILGVALFISSKTASSGKYDDFATCLKDKGAIFYGASWCLHCKAEKKLFGSSEKLLPYVQCSKKIGIQSQECKDKKIMAYPTWRFADGSELTGKISLVTLAEKTSCVLPQ